ncbi:MAG TPA: hypothetical protein PLE19_14450 [Planctomycetota bacterium]|nr:hypothetical protein [Planctomycetota bacterium]HRR82950.1 hypothetical protein [Planctomycetota bacterium]HRT96570.1 hypothetical protein [Planctomycetota bacterium]
MASLLLPSPALGAEPLATFECVERLGRDWRRTMLTYPLKLDPGKARPGQVRLVDDAGLETLCQLWDVKLHPDGSIATARLSFMAELKKGGSFRYRLLPEKPNLPKTRAMAAEIAPTGGVLNRRQVLTNGLVTVELEKKGERRLAKPAPLGTVGPLREVTAANRATTGGSYFWAERPEEAPRVTGYTSAFTADGPLFAEGTVRYTFDNGGFYQLTARIIAGDPAVRIDEQFDMKRVGSGKALQVAFVLNENWSPTHVFWHAPQGRETGHDEAFEAQLAAAGFQTKPYAGNTFGSRKLSFHKDLDKVFDVAVWYPWHPAAHYFGLVETSRGFQNPREVGFFAVVPLHAGNWRSAHQQFQTSSLYTRRGNKVELRWPLVAEPHPNTLLHTGEYDPALPLSFVRRQWALVAGPLQYHDTLHSFRAEEGYVNLDDYKDWVLDWPADPKVTYPRLVFSKEDVERLKPNLATTPGGDVLGKFLYFSDDDKRREELWKSLTHPGEWSSPLGQTLAGLSRGGDARDTTWVSSYRQTQMAGWAGRMDELLSSPRLTDEQRRTLRCHLAAVCSLLSEPDFNPRGAMMHLGNPNMPINRFMGLAFAAALIPDHPRAREWLDVAAKYLRYKLAMNTGPTGAWSELLTYFGASAPHIMQAATVLGRTGRLDESTARLAAMPARFTLQLLAPKDPRFGARSLPNWGHEGIDLCTHWLVAAGLMRDLDPELAKALAWAWDQTGRPMEQHHDAGFAERVIANADLLSQLPAGYVPKELASTWLPGFGAVLRAHAGDPNETFFALRQGYLTSHCDANQGDFIIHAKGAPFSTLSLFGYAIHGEGPFAKLSKEFGWHNRVRFGARTDDGGWPGGGPISQLHAHSFTPSVDYLRGEGDYGPQRWTRQVLFLKGKAAEGPNYFVLRDSFAPTSREFQDPREVKEPEGDAKTLQAKWWYLRTPGKKDLVKTSESGLDYTSPFGPKLHARFLQPTSVAAETRDATQAGPMYNRPALCWQKAGSPVLKGSETSIQVEETISVTAFGPVGAGKDILVMLYPQAPDEAPPKCEPLADGVARLTTSEGTDYVFASAKPIKFSQGDSAFEGIAGALRVYPSEVHLIIAEGPGSVSFKGTTLRSPIPAHCIIPVADLAKPATIEVPAAFDREKKIVVGGSDKLRAWGCDGPYEVAFGPDRIKGKTGGLGRFLYLTRPEGLDRLPMLVIDGQTFAPGTAGDTLIVPILPGEYTFEIRALDPPPIWRNWQAWPD